MAGNSTDEVLRGIREDCAKLRRLTTGNKELEAVAQILDRLLAILSDLDGRFREIEATHARPHPRHLEDRGSRQPEDAGADD